MSRLKKLLIIGGILFSLAIIICLSVYTRMSTINSPTVLDYDPFWFFRHAKEIVENSYKVPKWDLLSYYPPGRPYESFQGWPYTIAIMYKILSSIIPTISLIKVAIISPLIVAALIPIPAFFIGRFLSNNIGGIAVALFSVLTPALLGVSMAGYCDTDIVVVFYTFLSILTILLAIHQFKKGWLRFIPFAIIAIFVSLLFVYNWGAGWLPQIFFLVLIPVYFIFKIFETKFQHKKFDLNIISQETKPIFAPLLIIILVSNVIGYSLGWGSVVHSFLGGLGFTGFSKIAGVVGIFSIGIYFVTLASVGFIAGLLFFKKRGAIIGTAILLLIAILVITLGGVPQALLVNISVAELQKINIFTKAGFNAVADRVGLLPTLLTIIGLPVLILYKFFKKEKLLYTDIYLFLWMLVTFILILSGVRFSILFSTATAASAGYVIGNLFVYLRNRNIIILSTVFGLIAFLSIIFVSNAIQAGYSASGMTLSQNWYDMLDWLKENASKDSLVATWWDPGHIITGYTGLKVMADGAHCVPGICIPYNHNIRIQDTGKMFSTNNETESVQILSKYKELTPEQCQEARVKFGSIMPEDACDPVNDIYVIASSDLIGKYYWMSFFGSWDDTNKTGDGKNFIQLQYSGMDSSGLPTYGSIITLIQKDNQLLGVLNIPQQGIRNAIIKDIDYFYQGKEIRYQVNATNQTNIIDGLLWVDPSFQVVIFMEPSVRDSVFTNMFFFNGNGAQEFNISKLKDFELVYTNSEIRIFKVL
jgi:dolichyl-diphosphooligosaccharide--protein glycosyltransferase